MGQKRKLGTWRGDPPASEQAIQNLLADCGLKLPETYLAQLRLSNGGEGDLAIEPGWVCFWPAEKVVECNQSYDIKQYLPNFFGFGSNGGGELLAFKIEASESWPVFMISFIPLEEEYAVKVAEDFGSFREAIGYELEGSE